MSKCPACGAELSYDIKDEKVYCEYCRSTFDPKELETKTKYANERKQFEGKSYTCHQCGATLLTFDETAITFCSYCGSQSMIESKMIKTNNPDFIIPFKKTREECISEYKKLLRKALFVPRYMKEEMTVEKLRGIYMPYCVYKTSFHGISSNNGQKYSHRSGNYVYYDIYTIKARVDADYDGISYDMLSKFSDKYSKGIPFDYKEAILFNKNYLTGFYADTKDVNEETYDEEAEKICTADTTKHMLKKRDFTKYGCYNPKAGMKVKTRKIGMFPVYFLAIRDSHDKLHYAVINGQTGKIAADLPIDFMKYILGTLVLAVPIFFLLNLGTVILPKTILLLSMLAALITWIISSKQLNKVYEKEKKYDDAGYLSVNDEKALDESKKKNKFVYYVNGVKKEKYTTPKMPFKQKFKYLYKQLITIIAGLLVLLSGTIKDEPYYIVGIISFVIILFSFKDLVKEHNMLSSNKLPQLEKRGGDEREK